LGVDSTTGWGDPGATPADPGCGGGAVIGAGTGAPVTGAPGAGTGSTFTAGIGGETGTGIVVVPAG